MSGAGRICVVVPAYNAEDSVAEVVRGALRHVETVIVADDGSTDRTASAARDAGASVLVIEENRGKGNALRVLFAEAKRRGFTAVVAMDADGQHDPEDLPAFLAAHSEDPEAIIAGSRMREPGSIPAHRYNSMVVARFYICLAANRYIQDTQCGFRLYPLSIIDGMALRKEKYVTETEILVKSGDSGHRVITVPVRTIYHATGYRTYFRSVPDVAAISVYVISYLMVKWAIEGTRPGVVNTYRGPGTGRDRFGRTPRADYLFEVLTLLSSLPLTALYFGWYFLGRSLGMNVFAGLRTCGVSEARVLGSTLLLPMLLAVSIMDLAGNRLGLKVGLTSGFVRRFYPNLFE